MALTIAHYFDNPATIDELRRRGGTAAFHYDVAHWGNEELPVYGQPYATLQALSSDPKKSIDTLNQALAMLTEKVKSLQTSVGATGKLMIDWEPIGAVMGPQRQSLQRSRATVAIGLIALLASAATISFTRDRSRERPLGEPRTRKRTTTGIRTRQPKPARTGAGSAR
ncbi:hypothetical protein ACFFHJ_14545 [Planotetraspora thailandica]|nr:hypothetical protein [Planotetraspora thailandica]